jgi:hypothetical protein
MTTQNLISKLTKMNVQHTILDNNGYNKDVEFTINSLTFKAGFIDSRNIIEDFCVEIFYDNCTQETQRRFFSNFNKLLKYANA